MNLHLPVLTVVFCAFASDALLAQETAQARRFRTRPAAAAAAPDETATPAPAPPAYELKKRSTFAPVADTQRVPFWPIGWVKRKANATAEAAMPVAAPKVEIDEKSFKVSSILVGNPSLAIINGRTYMEGEFLRLPRAAGAAVVTNAPVPASARVRVFRINDGTVVLQHQEQLITIALQRPQLAQKTGREELLQDDRP